MSTAIQFEVLTLFPAAVNAFTGSGILGRAIADGLVQVHCTDIRAFTDDKHGRVDDAPFGGGAGMIIRAQPVVDALEHMERTRGRTHRILLTPAAPTFDQAAARRLAQHDRLSLICGRYEGVDDRVREHFVDECLSIGDYVLNGGEVAAAVVIEAVARLRSGVLGNAESLDTESFADGVGVLEHPQYTRPADFRGYVVPPVLTAGDHHAVTRWRDAAAIRRTGELRPGLLAPMPTGAFSHVYLVAIVSASWLGPVADTGVRVGGSRDDEKLPPAPCDWLDLLQPDGRSEAGSDPRVFEAGWILRLHSSRLEPVATSDDRGDAVSKHGFGGLRELRRYLTRRHGTSPVFVRVCPADSGTGQDRATDLVTCEAMARRAQVELGGELGASPLVFVVDDAAGTSPLPASVYHATLGLHPTGSRSGLADERRIEHPSHPVASEPLRALVRALTHELSELRRTRFADNGRDP